VTLQPGTRVGPYEIIGALGAGGMGEVYRAHDLRLDRDVAVKVLPASVAPTPERLHRFEQEARAAAALNHPNIVAVFDIGLHDGAPYMVSELLEGDTLGARLSDGGLSIETLVEWAMQVADALDAAHAKGIVHRDIKPANLFVTARGQIKVLDFGLAKFLGNALAHAAAAPTVQVTEAGATFGTVAYMSPEQARGEAVDARSDLFSFGVVLYEMAAGHRPFGGATNAVVFEAILNRQPVPAVQHNSHIVPELDRIITRSLEKLPSRRYQHARELLTDLGALRTQAPAARALPSIAVLPFADMSAGHDQEYFCEGMAEELINALSGLEGVRVAARSSAFQFKGGAVDIQKVGRQLHVDTVLEGSVRKAGNRLRITAQLISVSDGYHLWSERYDRDMDDIFAVQDEIAQAIVKKLQVKLGGESARPLVTRQTADVEAYGLYLQGRFYWSRRDSGFLQRAIECFEQAIARDPSYAPAYAGLADGFTILGVYGWLPPRVAVAKARRAAERAVQLDDGLAEAHQALALVQWYFDSDFPAAERSFGRALALNPSSGLAHAQFGVFLSYLGRFDEAISEVTSGRALEPVSTVVGVYAAATLLFGGRRDEADAECQRVLDFDPASVWMLYIRSYVLTRMGKHDDAIAAADLAVELSHRQMFCLATAGVAHAAAGRSEDAQTALDELRRRSQDEYVSPIFFAWIAGELGKVDEALRWYERAYDEGSPLLNAMAVRTGRADPSRADPRFGALLKKIGLAGVTPAY